MQSRTGRNQALGRLAGHPSGDMKGDEHGPASTGQSSREITRSHHLHSKSARAPTASRHLTASVAASNHVRSTTVVGVASSSCLLCHALRPVSERTAWTRTIPRSPLEDSSTSKSGSSTISPIGRSRTGWWTNRHYGPSDHAAWTRSQASTSIVQRSDQAEADRAGPNRSGHHIPPPPPAPSTCGISDSVAESHERWPSGGHL